MALERRADAVASPTAEAVTVFGDSLELATQYAQILVSDGVRRGLIGPREVDRIWPRHLVNCAVVTDLLPVDATVVDVGSGAGLPGLVLAIRRPDLAVTLVEPLQRRVDFLAETSRTLGLDDRVRIVHGRAEDAAARADIGAGDWVTARAVAPLDRLVRWCLPLLRSGGTLAAIKGASAADEVSRHRLAIHRAGGRDVEVVKCGVGIIAQPTTVVAVRREAASARRGQ